METWTVYILLCSDEKPYTGCTSNFEERLARHQKGNVTATKFRLPVCVVLKISFYNKYRAFAFEKYLKTGSGIAFSRRHFLPDFKCEQV
jgi:predicted GIY-YIG superfamily endonuclease